MTTFHKFVYVGPEMENKGHKENTCEEKNIFPPKMASENAYKKCGFHLWKSNFKVQDTTKSVKQKRCGMFEKRLYQRKTIFWVSKDNKHVISQRVQKLFFVNIKQIVNIQTYIFPHLFCFTLFVVSWTLKFNFYK